MMPKWTCDGMKKELHPNMIKENMKMSKKQRSWACQRRDLIKTEFTRRRPEAREALFISVRPPKSPHPCSDSPANVLWCHPPGVQWLMHPGCQRLHSCEVREPREEVNGLNFPQIETSKCEQSPAWGRFRAQPNVLHTCNIVNVLFLMSS